MTRLGVALAALVMLAGPRVLAADAPPSDAAILRHGKIGCHQLALTFDLCPIRKGTGFDEALIDELVRDQVPATFFVSGRWIASHDAELRRLIAVPFFEIETHGERHIHLKGKSAVEQRAEIAGPVERLRTRYGLHPTLFRPPFGEYDETTLAVAHELGLRVVMWSAVSGDPDPHLSEAEIVTEVSHHLRDGEVVVFHANGRGWHTRDSIHDLEPKIAAAALHPQTLRGLGACVPAR